MFDAGGDIYEWEIGTHTLLENTFEIIRRLVHSFSVLVSKRTWEIFQYGVKAFVCGFAEENSHSAIAGT